MRSLNLLPGSLVHFLVIDPFLFQNSLKSELLQIIKKCPTVVTIAWTSIVQISFYDGLIGFTKLKKYVLRSILLTQIYFEKPDTTITITLEHYFQKFGNMVCRH